MARRPEGVPIAPQREIGCPDCGHDGPHAIIGTDLQSTVIECANSACGVEFYETPDDDIDVG